MGNKCCHESSTDTTADSVKDGDLGTPFVRVKITHTKK